MDRGASGYPRSPPSSKKVTWMEPIEQGGAAVRVIVTSIPVLEIKT